MTNFLAWLSANKDRVLGILSLVLMGVGVFVSTATSNGWKEPWWMAAFVSAIGAMLTTEKASQLRFARRIRASVARARTSRPRRCTGLLPSSPENVLRRLHLTRYMAVRLTQTPPDSVDHSTKLTSIGMHLNDSLGDCTVAGYVNWLEVITSLIGSECLVVDSDVRGAYFAITGGPDAGADLETVLNYMRTQGIAGHFLGAYAYVDPQNIVAVKNTINDFEGAYAGWAMPQAWCNGPLFGVWDVGGDVQPDESEGHCMEIVGYNAIGPIVLTWDAKMQMTWRAFVACCRGVFALISPEMLDPATGKTPDGLLLTDLQSDLAAVTA